MITSLLFTIPINAFYIKIILKGKIILFIHIIVLNYYINSYDLQDRKRFFRISFFINININFIIIKKLLFRLLFIVIIYIEDRL